jgi:hypothetical protein
MSLLVQLRDLLLERAQESSIRIGHFLGGRRQFSLENANSVRNSTPRSIAARARSRARPRRPAVAGDARQQPLLRPASVAVHDDRDVARHVAPSGTSRVELVRPAAVRRAGIRSP